MILSVAVRVHDTGGVSASILIRSALQTNGRACTHVVGCICALARLNPLRGFGGLARGLPTAPDPMDQMTASASR